MLFSSRLIYTVIFYLLLMVIIFMQKPRIIFNEDNSLKNFGFGENQTLYSMGTFSIVIAIISFYIFALIDYIFNN